MNATHHPPRDPVAWIARYRRLRTLFALGVLALLLLLAVVMWTKDAAFTIDPGKGTPIGPSVRIASHIATLIRTLEPYTPSLHHDPSTETHGVHLLLVPLDGSDPRRVPVANGLPANATGLAKIFGSDGRTLWFDVNGPAGVDLETFARIGGDQFRKANPALDPIWWEDGRGMEVQGRLRSTARDRQRAMEFDPRTLKALPVAVMRSTQRTREPEPGDLLCAGVYTSSTTWMGVHAATEVERDHAPNARWQRVVRAADTRVPRVLYRGVFDADSSGGGRRMIRMEPIGGGVFINAAFLSADDRSEPIRLSGPAGVLMLHTSAEGLYGTLLISRVDLDGQVRWTTDTGLDRSALQQILPGPHSTVFVGTRIPVPGKVSGSMLVIVEHGQGAVRVVPF